MRFLLHRTAICTEGAFGTLAVAGEPPFAVTLERTFENNRVVIPAGMSFCKKRRYNKGGYDSYEVVVPNHKYVMFHKGNKEIHSTACILVGEMFYDFGDMDGIGQSKHGFDEFLEKTKNVDNFELVVFDPPIFSL